MNFMYRIFITLNGNDAELTCTCSLVSSSRINLQLELLSNNTGRAGAAFDAGGHLSLQLDWDSSWPETEARNLIWSELKKIFGKDAKVNILGDDPSVVMEPSSYYGPEPTAEAPTAEAADENNEVHESDDNAEYEDDGKRNNTKTVRFDLEPKGLGYKAPTEENDIDLKYVKVPVLYATDRKPTGKTAYESWYGAQVNNTLEYGKCEVSIPKEGRRAGEIPRPIGWLKWLLPENPDKHVVILDLKTLKADDFFGSLDEAASASSEKDALIFVHGFNVAFAEAVRRTAQIKYDLNFHGAAITYSWPSQASTAKYMADEQTVEMTVPHLVQFIKDVVAKAPHIEKLHFIAHSMGNRALTHALKEMQDTNTYPPQINQVILAAPDVDAVVFAEQIAPRIAGRKRVTLYASDKDKAIIASRLVKSGFARAGEGGERLTVVQGIDTIDASLVEFQWFALAHSYFGDTKLILDDIFNILRHQHGPQDRNLLSKQKNGVTYWSFPQSGA